MKLKPHLVIFATMYPSGYPEKLNPAILGDESLKSNHHIFQRILKETQIGEIRETDVAKSLPEALFYWVKFHYAAILLSEKHLLPV